MSPSPFSNMHFFCSEIFTQLNHNMIFFHGLWMDNVCRSKFEDRLNRFKSYGQKSGQIWVPERFFEKVTRNMLFTKKLMMNNSILLPEVLPHHPEELHLEICEFTNFHWVS